ncbi:hypothetical protein bthur0005_56610 [Bacillus thuringiensis serovar pakistani str. T13001]|nr:hypothetical protein bthur0005_56610 [Bacillus thuringiensis serovar pakistani str. T13001]
MGRGMNETLVPLNSSKQTKEDGIAFCEGIMLHRMPSSKKYSTRGNEK